MCNCKDCTERDCPHAINHSTVRLVVEDVLRERELRLKREQFSREVRSLIEDARSRGIVIF